MYGGSSNAGEGWTTNNTAMAPYRAVMEEIHVLLVDHDSNSLFEIGRMLDLCSYRVTPIDYASSAITMLSNQRTVFDVVMARADSPDLHGCKLMQLAVAMSIPFVLLSVDEDAFLTTKAVQDGAFLNIHKPVPIDVLKYLWQLVLREKTQKVLRNNRELNVTNNNFNYDGGVNNELMEMGNCMDESFEMEYFGDSSMNSLLSSENNNGNNNDDGMYNNEEHYDAANHRSESHMVRRKVCTEWTDELHSKFVDVVLTLGEGRCFPKEIMQLMIVPGLTRMQVASHLQKCRNEKWLSPEERKAQLAIQSGLNSEVSLSQPLPVRARFGSMPRVSKSFSNQTNYGTYSHYLTNPDETGIVQNVVGGLTEPMNQVVDNPRNEENYRAVVLPRQVFSEINNVVNNYGAGTDQYLLNPSDEFFNFGDSNNWIKNLVSTPQDSFAGLFNNDHPEPYCPTQNNGNNPRNYDQGNGASEFGNHGSNVNASG